MDTDNSATGRASDKFMLRLPDGMREQLKTSAIANKRTLNAEIVARLEASFEEAAKEMDLAQLGINLTAVADHLESLVGRFESARLDWKDLPPGSYVDGIPGPDGAAPRKKGLIEEHLPESRLSTKTPRPKGLIEGAMETGEQPAKKRGK